MTEFTNPALLNEPSEEPVVYDEEEFFERDLFQDILNMRSLLQVSETTATDLQTIQEQTYQSVFNLFQKIRGLSTTTDAVHDEVYGIFELFFKNYYQHFRRSMETMLMEKSPVKVAFYLGKNSDKFVNLLEVFIRELEKEIK